MKSAAAPRYQPPKVQGQLPIKERNPCEESRRAEISFEGPAITKPAAQNKAAMEASFRHLLAKHKKPFYRLTDVFKEAAQTVFSDFKNKDDIKTVLRYHLGLQH